MKKTILFLFANIFIFSFFSCAQKLPVQKLTVTTQKSGQVCVLAEVAKTQAQRNRGFMERKNIPAGTGMIFVFERDQILSFWMKNTPHPLSIAYIDSTGTIRDIFDMTPFSLSSVTSTVSVRYALEVPKGWFEENGIKAGDKVSLPE